IRITALPCSTLSSLRSSSATKLLFSFSQARGAPEKSMLMLPPSCFDKLSMTWLERIAAGCQHPAQVERQGENAPVRFGVVEKALATQARAVGIDAAGFEAREVDPVAAGQEGPIGIEGRH